jgi:hypothetical protein
MRKSGTLGFWGILRAMVRRMFGRKKRQSSIYPLR